jgi:hypothetical protein
MKITFTLLLTCFISFCAKAQLTAGDIAIIAMNADNNATPILGENFVFVALKDIPANTTITFTDNAWDAVTETFRTNEGYVQWTHTAIVPAGTVITVNSSAANSWTAPSPSVGTATGVSTMAFSTDGDQIIAFEGTWADRPSTGSSAKFLFAFSLENFITVQPSTSQESNLPSALSMFSVAMKDNNTETDNAYFADGNVAVTAVSVSGSKAQLLAKFMNPTLYFQSNTLSALPTYATTLPITLASFKGTIQNNKALLRWETISEVNFSHFEIEKSINGVEFTAIANVIGNNSNGSKYSYTDASINSETYYRLKNIDKDGKYSFSNIVALKNIIFIDDIKIYPNPILESVTINHSVASNGNVRFATLEGKTILVQKIEPNTVQTSINTNDLSKGVFIIHVLLDGKTQSNLVIKN